METGAKEKNSIDLFYTIGRGEHNNICIDKKTISHLHARIHFLTANTFILEDLNSTNGTFLNHLKIRRAVGSRADKIYFADLAFDLNKYLPENSVNQILLKKLGIEPPKQVGNNPQNGANDFSNEFNALKLVYEEYVDKRKKLQDGHAVGQRIGGFMPGAIANVVGQGVGHAIIPGFGGMAISILFSFGGCIAGIFATKAASKEEKIKALDKEYKKTFVCPNCKTPLAQFSWEDLAMKKNCFACKAIWVKP